MISREARFLWYTIKVSAETHYGGFVYKPVALVGLVSEETTPDIYLPQKKNNEHNR